MAAEHSWLKIRKRTVKLKMRMDADRSLAREIRRLDGLVNRPDVIAKLMRLAVAETVLVAVRNQFLEHLTDALNMEVIHDSGPKSEGVVLSSIRAKNTEEEVTLKDLYDTLQQAQLSGNARRIGSAHKKLQAHYQKYIKSLQRLKNGTQKPSHPLSSGKFRPMALKVLALLTDANLMQVSTDQGNVQVSVGNRMLLDAIKTPSATQWVLGVGRTRSPYDVMWRHLEFGTGLYASDPDRGDYTSRFKETGGRSWYYGLHKDAPRLVLQGSRGVHFLKAAYDVFTSDEVASFKNVFGLLLSDALTARH